MLSHTQKSFITELWIEFAIGLLVFFLRFFARWRTVGCRNFSWDDYWAGVSMLFWIGGLATLDTTVRHGTNVGLTAETALQLPPAVVKSLEFGSKALFAAWFLYVTIIWTLKATVLGYYLRLTAGLWQNKLVKIMTVICFLSWSSLIVLIFCRCRPIHKNWQIVPYAGDKCTHSKTSILVLMLLNVLDDIGLVAIPAFVLYEAKLPLRRKLILSALLSSSIFIIACALLRGIVALESIANVLISMQWGAREAFITIIVINVPAIKPLFSSTGTRGSNADFTFQTHLESGRGCPPSSRGDDIQLQYASVTRKDATDDDRSMSSDKELFVQNEYGVMETTTPTTGSRWARSPRIMEPKSPFSIHVTTDVNVEEEENVSREDMMRERKRSAAPSDWEEGGFDTQVVGGRESRLESHF